MSLRDNTNFERLARILASSGHHDVPSLPMLKMVVQGKDPGFKAWVAEKGQEDHFEADLMVWMHESV